MAGSQSSAVGWIGRLVDAAVDELLEASVAGSFSALGIGLRRSVGRRLGTWGDLPAMDGRTVVVTGGTSGIGLALAVTLGGLGADVHLVGRDATRASDAEAAVARAARHAGRVPKVRSTLADLADPAAVRKVAAAISEGHAQVDVLVHGAGALLRRYQVGPDGTETTVAVHVLAPFLLTGLLTPALAAGGGGRVVTVTSGGMYMTGFEVDTLEATAEHYDATATYARAKRAQVLLTGQWARRLATFDVSCHVMHPGWVDTPGLRSGMPRFATLTRSILRTPADGADTVAWLAAASEPLSRPGRLWHDRRPRSAYRLPWTWVSPRTEAAQGEALWQWCASRPAWYDGWPVTV